MLLRVRFVTSSNYVHLPVLIVAICAFLRIIFVVVVDAASAAEAAHTTSISSSSSSSSTFVGDNHHDPSQVSYNHTDDSRAPTKQHPQQELWQECSIFLAPSWTGGYGVYAGRDFVKDEIVELAPFFLAVDHHGSPFVQQSALQDYVYGYTRLLVNIDEDDGEETIVDRVNLAAIVWGMTMWYNHHPTDPNVEWTLFGNEPYPSESFTHPNVQVVGFIARRNIQAGEELFSSYGEEDRGHAWFTQRGIDMSTAAPTSEESRLTTNTSLQELEERYKQPYCSKMYAGIDQWVYQHRLRTIQPDDYPHLVTPVERLVPPPPSHSQRWDDDYNHPDYPWAIAKVPIVKGDRIELAPALVLDRHTVIRTAMAPLVYYWQDFHEELQASIRQLRQQGYYVVQRQDPSTDWQRQDRFTSFEDSVILPVAGWIGRVERVGVINNSNNKDAINNNIDHGQVANCYMKIHASSPMHIPKSAAAAVATAAEDESSDAAAAAAADTCTEESNPFSTGNAGIVLELIASRDIAVGERIRVNLPPPSVSFKERLALYKEMERSGQLYAPLNAEIAVEQPQQQEHELEQEQES